jgi:hypothetical protein
MFFIHLIFLISYLIKLSTSQTVDLTKPIYGRGLPGKTIIPVNEQIFYNEEFPTIALLKDDNVVIAWSGGTSQTGTCPPSCYYNIYFNTYDAFGNKLLAHPQVVNTPGSYKSTLPFTVSDGNGGFVITWEQIDSSFDDIYVRHYDASLTPGNIIKINTLPVGGPVTSNSYIDRLANGNFIIVFSNSHNGYDVYGQLLDPNMNLVGIMFPVSDFANGMQMVPAAIGLQGGGFMIVWQGDQNGTGNWDIYAKKYNEFSQPITSEFRVNTNNQVGTQKNPRLAQLLNGNIVVIWSDLNYNRGDIYSVVYDSKGGIVQNVFFVNILDFNDVEDFPRVTALSFGGYIIIWESRASASNSKLVLQVYSEIGTAISAILNFASTNPSNGAPVELLKEQGVVIAYEVSGIIIKNDILAQYLYINLYACEAITKYQGKNDLRLKLDLSMELTNVAQIKSLPTKGQLKRSNNSVIVKDALVSTVYDLYYVTSSQTSDSFTYIIDMNDTPCVYSIIPCYVSCLTCDIGGDSTNNNCTQCDTNSNYFPIYESTNGNCYTSTTNMRNYYFDSGTKYFMSCYSTCATCSKAGSSLSNNCDTCEDGYNPLEDNLSQCISINDTPLGYYLDDKQMKFMKCYASCYKCKVSGDDINHNCLRCKDNFVRLVDNQYNCFAKDSKITGYYFDQTFNRFNHCYDTCNTCTGSGTFSSPKCIDCKKEYPNCMPSVSQNTILTLNCPYKIFNNICYDECPQYTVPDPSSNKCLYCNSTQAIYSSACVDECPQNYIRDYSNICKQCSSDTYYYNKQCLYTCPINTKLNINTNICEDYCENEFYQEGIGCVQCQGTAKYYYNGSCYEQCPVNTIQLEYVCQDYISHNSKIKY